MLKLKAIERMQTVGPSQGQYRFVLQPEIYSTLSASKVIEEAAIRSGVSRGILQAAWDAISAVIKAWATEGHSVAIPSLGTMRFGVKGTAVQTVDEVGSSLVTTRKIIFTPSTEIKSELKATSINITCFNRNGEVVKRVNSSNSSVDDGVEKYTVSLTATQGGTVSGGGTYAAGTEVTITATANSGYTFSKWSDGNTSASRKITVDENISLQAQFTSDDNPLGGGGSGTPDLEP